MTFSTGQKVTSRWMNSYIRDNLIIRCTSTTHPEVPFYGMEIYETDTGTFLLWDGTVWKIVGTTQALPYVWTPLVVGVVPSSYVRSFYNILHGSIGILFYSSNVSSASGSITLTLPAAFSSVNPAYGTCGEGLFFDTSASNYYPLVVHITGGTIMLWTGSGVTAAAFSNTNPVTIDSGDTFSFSAIVELQ